MTRTQSLMLSPFVALALLGACAQGAEEAPIDVAEATETPSRAPVTTAPASKVTLRSPITTRKPGAAVTFSHDLVAVIQPGAIGTLTVTVNEGYPEGVMSLSATGDPGLSVFGAESEMDVDLSTGTSHTWRLNYSAEEDGSYYVNLFAIVDPGNGSPISRSAAVQVRI